jgi:Tfp pilus assembly protein PilF
MMKRTLIAMAITVAVIVALQPTQTVHGILLSAAEIATLDAANTPANSASKAEGQGNSFVRALGAPFRAIGRLFGRGKKNNNKIERISEKDIRRFESAPLAEVKDATVGQPDARGNPADNAASHLEQGRTLLDNGYLNEAIEELSSAASIDPGLAEARNLLGVAYERKNLPELARRAFEDALKLDGANAQILNNLGYLLYKNGDYRAAADRLKKAVKLAPGDPRILNNLALAQSQMGKFNDAYKNFVQAGGEITGRLNVANQLEIAGRSEEALKHYEAARLRAQQSTTSGTQEITVVIEVQRGRVTFASVKNHRRGMEAYEATALRLVRERRYPTDKNGQDSVVVRITAPPAS